MKKTIFWREEFCHTRFSVISLFRQKYILICTKTSFSFIRIKSTRNKNRRMNIFPHFTFQNSNFSDKRVTVLPAIFWHNLSLLQNAPEAADNQRQMSKREKVIFLNLSSIRRMLCWKKFFFFLTNFLNSNKKAFSNLIIFQLDARFGDVLEFVKDFELMNVDYIVIPVNEWEHW